MDDAFAQPAPAHGKIVPPGLRAIGLFPAGFFAAPSASRHELCGTPVARWCFRNETIVVPATSRASPYCNDGNTAAPSASAHPPDTLPETPALVWIAAEYCISGVRINHDGNRLVHGAKEIPLLLTARHPLNQAFFDSSSLAWLQQRRLFVRGTLDANGGFVARTLWPEDFALPEAPPLRQAPADPLALRARIRERPVGGARSPFSVESLWQADNFAGLHPGRPAIAFILNGAQGDDDEAHGGHFAIATGRIGDGGAIHDWLVANFYTLDTESEKGIIAASLPLDNYFADLNAGQSWYRPSHILVATLRDTHAATELQSALSKAFRDFYCRRLRYHHAAANCTGISVSTLRTLGWRIPDRGAESWLKAFGALLLTSFRAGLARGKMQFEYLTEDQTRLYPAVAFEEIGADLLRLVSDREPAGGHTEFERRLAADIDSLVLACIPQFPSSRAWGNHAVVDSREYQGRLPVREEDRRIIRLAPRHLPAELLGEEYHSTGWQRSDYAVLGLGCLLATAVAAWLRA